MELPLNSQAQRRPSSEQVLSYLIQSIQVTIEDGYRDFPDDNSLKPPMRKCVLRCFQHVHVFNLFEEKKHYGNLLGVWLIDGEKCISSTESAVETLLTGLTQESNKLIDQVGEIHFSYDLDTGDYRRTSFFLKKGAWQDLYTVHLTNEGEVNCELKEPEWIGSC